jgi:arabinoxylan arabinofuranohydrolase
LEYKNNRNPVLPTHLHIPDPEAHVMPDGRVYIYGSWDQDEKVYCSREYGVFSSSDMINWVDHGVSFQSSQVHWVFDETAPKYPGLDWSSSSPSIQKIVQQYREMYEKAAKSGVVLELPESPKDLLFAPDAIYRNGQYYLYFCMSDDSEGVAVSDNPQGPFMNPIQLPCGGIDPAVFIDDDGQAYYYWGQIDSKAVKLKDNMVEFIENTMVEKLVTEVEHYFHEGSSVRKRGETYYYVYSSTVRGKATSLAYATSRSPLGPFEYRGVIIDNDGCDPQSWNNHGSIEEVNGQWYVFYHRSSRNSKEYRRLCVEPIFFNEDGTINEVPMTSQGAGSPFGCGERIEAYRACQLSGSIYIAPTDVMEECLLGIKSGDQAIFRYTEWNTIVNEVAIQASGNGEIAIYLNDDCEPAGRVTIKNGEPIHSVMRGPSGRHEIRLQFHDVDGLVVHNLCFR